MTTPNTIIADLTAEVESLKAQRDELQNTLKDHGEIQASLCRQINEIKRQRDVLLDALTLIATGEETNGCIPSLGWAIDIADDAIANAKGESC